ITLPAASVQYVGIELLTPEGRRVAAGKAAADARAVGLDVLPFPVLGRPYEFAVNSQDGRRLRARDFRGKVLVIHFWASWCAPCMQEQPALKALYAKRRADGLEIIAVNLDKDDTKMREALEALALPWPQCLAPRDEKKLELWETASGIDSI